jgi:hypothetical protein
MDLQPKCTYPFYTKLRAFGANLLLTGRGLSLPLILHLISWPIFLPPVTPNMLASQVQCHGCERWFSHRGLTQHISKTQDARCRDALTMSQVPYVSSSIQCMATPPQLSLNGASPVSRGSEDTEIAVTRGVCYCFSFVHMSESYPQFQMIQRTFLLTHTTPPMSLTMSWMLTPTKNYYARTYPQRTLIK